MPPKPDFLAIGHVTLDLTERGPVPGGAAFYASMTAAGLGWRSGLLTRGVGPEVEEHLCSLDLVVNAPSEVTTTFEMRYSSDARTQTLHAVAPPIEDERLPAGWGEVRVALLAPVFHDVPSSLAGRFPQSLLGVAPQGWLRRTSSKGLVRPADWYDAQVLSRADVVILSELDVAGGRIPARWLDHCGIFILTKGKSGAVMRYGGGWFNIPAYPAREADPTGAGDVFAAAFLIRYFETNDAFAAGLFASCAASLKVEGIGAAAIPTRAQIQLRMSRYPTLKVKPTAAGASSSDKSQDYESGDFDNHV